jgi:hypothetical protein
MPFCVYIYVFIYISVSTESSVYSLNSAGTPLFQGVCVNVYAYVNIDMYMCIHIDVYKYMCM